MDKKIQEAYTENIFGLSIPVLALDIVIFTISRGKLSLVMAKRDKDPGLGKYILPGGVVKSGMSLEENFDDILFRKTGIQWVYKEQLYTFWEPSRDSRGHIVSIAYYALVREELFRDNADYNKIELLDYYSLDPAKIAFDHHRIIEAAKQRLIYKLEYTNIAYNILKEAFTLTELQNVYEIILSETIDKRNFRKKILSLDIIRETGETAQRNSNRPAKLYEFTQKDLQITRII